MWLKLRKYFLTGLVVIAPISITVYLTWKVVNAVDNLVRSLLPAAYNPETYLAISLPGIGLIITFVFLTVLGALAANVMGRALIGLGEKIVNRMPVIRGIYTTVKQIAETMMAQSSSTFRDVVLIEYPRKGLWALAFVSSNAMKTIEAQTGGEDMLNVFLPTTPNPTSGFLLFVPRSECIFLDISVEQAVKYIISAGLVAPDDADRQKIRLKATKDGAANMQ